MLTKLSITLFVLSALLILMACVKADRVRGWRQSLNPSAPELPDAAFVVARITLAVMAVAGIVVGLQGLGVQDASKWSDDELKSAVEQATSELDGYLYRVDESGDPIVYFHTYDQLVETEVAENGGADAPQDGVDAAPLAANTDADAYFRVTANGADTEYCTHIKRIRSKKDDYTPPGLDEGTYTQFAYRLSVKTQQGPC
ncbi:hypothetical protein [Streptomyces sp. JB150]|uniref:hypothetical protein n=1 Tax=Streptomyces sp. JB150 TaxID=2714844 RepID=UPI00140B8EE5|nr:hypothetical protein [Streptomyces sp. JB150]QIJ65061.1 hypothetical protein G7Z13_25785 [Streptomyces sp. JB150]